MGSEVIILEEGAHADPAVFYEVILPICGVRNTVFICITTPLDEGNFVQQLTEVTDEHGNTYYNVIELQLVCKRCNLRHFKGDVCAHRIHLIPPWQSGGRRQFIKAVMCLRDPALYDQEQRGIAPKLQQACFHA